MQITVSHDVHAPAERTWAVLTDLDRATEVLSGVRRIERLDGASGSIEVGTRWRETRVMFRREATEEMVVTAIEPGSACVVEADGAGAHYRSELRVEPLEDGRSRLSMTFGAEPTGLVARVMAATVGRLMAGSMRKMLRRDLQDIARAAESTAG